MRNTFRYSLTLDDYLSYNRTAYKKSIMAMSVFVGSFIVITAVYYYFVMKNAAIFIGLAVAVLFAATYMLYMYNIGIKKRFIRQNGNCRFYFEEKEITITPDSIESRNLPDADSAGIVGIYPYSIMKVIYETDSLFVFVIGNEAKMFPKRAVPPQMQEEVFNQLRSRKKYMKLG